MGCFDGPKTTTTSTNTQSTDQQQHQTSNQSGSSGSQTTGGQTATSFSSTNPNLPDWFMPYKQGIAQQYAGVYGQLGQMAQHPLYGAPQQANFQESLNRALGGASQGLMSGLASRGALNSGNAAQTQTGLQLGGVHELQNYLANVPIQNAQYKEGLLGHQAEVLNAAGNLTVPYGQTTTSNTDQNMWNNVLNQFLTNGSSDMNGTSNSSSSGTQTQQQSGGLLQSVLGGLINAGLGAATGGLSSLFSGGGNGGGAQGGYGSGGGPGMPNLPQQSYTSPFSWGTPTGWGSGNSGGLPGGFY